MATTGSATTGRPRTGGATTTTSVNGKSTTITTTNDASARIVDHQQPFDPLAACRRYLPSCRRPRGVFRHHDKKYNDSQPPTIKTTKYPTRRGGGGSNNYQLESHVPTATQLSSARFQNAVASRQATTVQPKNQRRQNSHPSLGRTARNETCQCISRGAPIHHGN